MDLVVRAAVAFFFILLVIRIVGKRELSSMEPIDLIMLIVLGDLVQQGVTQNDLSLTGMVIVISVIALLTAFVSYVNSRLRWVRPVLEGKPVVLIENGRPIDDNIREERLTRPELEEQARLQQIESLDDVKLAVLETSGRISFIPRKGSGG
jgi:uncharacterized membrane protein YcaP (DUF421 family)